MRNALSIDVEEHFQVHAFEKVLHRSDWERFPSRVVSNTQRIMKLLAKYDVRATFFVLGWVADRFPELVQEIVDGGHELGTHGYWHELVYRQTPEDFADDIDRSLDALYSAAGNVPIVGYRAPAFSITEQSLWALDVLHNRGLRYDSSIFPLTAHDRYGIRGAQRFANQLPNGLWEFPVSTVRIGKQNLPVAGGGYFRLYPLWITQRAVRHLNERGKPAILYLHPWEFDPSQPRVANAPMLSRFRHYVNLQKTEDRLQLLLETFEFATMQEVFAEHLEEKEYEPSIMQ